MSGKEITLIIDGREVSATEGEMLHDAAKRGDVEIPVFCYEPKLGDPVGACRMCLVEIEGIPKLQTSCSTPVRDGMVVHTRTEQVKEAQNAVVEFLLVNHPLDCPVCDKGGECPLQDISYGWGPGKSRFTDPKRHFQKPLPLSPLVAIDRERCILCYRCVRFSQEVSEDAQLQLLERGDRTYVGTFDERPYVAPFHGNITDICPVGALTNYTYRFRARPWDIEEAGSICTICPSQCNVSFTIRDERVKRVLARDNAEVDDGWLCDRGRYGFGMLEAEERVRSPRLRGGPAGWQEAIAKAAEGLRSAGAASAAIVGDASNEEGYLLQRILREALGSPHVDSRPSTGPSRELLASLDQPQLTARVRDLDGADAILLIGTEPLHSSPILDLRIRKAIRRNGARLVVASERPTTLDGGAAAALRYKPGEGGALLGELAAQLRSPEAAQTGASDSTEASATRHGGSGAAPAAQVLGGAGKAVVIWGERLGWEGAETTEALLDLAAALGIAEQDGGGLLEVPETTNARGLREAGCLPDSGPGLQPPAAAEVPRAEATSAPLAGDATPSGASMGRATEEIRAALESGELGAVVLFGVNPLRDFPDTRAWQRAIAAADHVIAFSMFENETTAMADVVFPLESHAEKDGTLTHPDGRLQRVRPSASRPGDIRPGWGVLAELSLALGHETGIDSQPSAFAALTQAVPFYDGISDADIGGRGVRWQDLPAASRFPVGTGMGSPGIPRASEPGDLIPAPTDDSGEAVGNGRQTPGEESLVGTGGPGSLVLGTYRDLWTGPVTELNPPLKFLEPQQTVEISPTDAERLGLKSGDRVTVGRDGAALAAKVVIRSRLQEGVCFLGEGIEGSNANTLRNGGPVQVSIEKASAR